MDWFRVDQHPVLDRPVLLPARWLAHLLGLRHGIIQLMLTVANPELQFLVQVRSMRKSSFPGCFDLPVAGHVDGLQSYEETLRKETREEISLDIDNLTGLTSLGNQFDCITISENLVTDCEYGRAFTANLDPALIPTLVPQPGELAALALFPLDELLALHAAFPDSFAPGIQRIFDIYPPK
jgi:8-oxo-dGTP pyrophosphatase MutT (NUDIX family)